MKFVILIFWALTLNKAADRPSTLWIVLDSMSSHFGFNGEDLVNTTHALNKNRGPHRFRN